MDKRTDVSSQNRPGRYVLDEGSSTRNRKVVGSNPTSSVAATGGHSFGWIAAVDVPAQACYVESSG